MDNTVAIFEKLQRHFDLNLPFVVYNKPNSERLIGIFQRDTAFYKVKDFTETGFVFAPFDGDEMLLIPQNQSDVVIANLELVPAEYHIETSQTDDHQEKQRYGQLVQKAIDAIHEQHFEKVVLSRKEVLSVPDFDLVSSFQKLLNTYPSAFAYCFFHPNTGLWLGAFSEQLVRVKEKNLHTMSVAGTQLHDEKQPIVWGIKEKAEQQFVTDFIVESLNEYVSEVKVSEPYTMQAGNLLHIKTDIEAALHAPSDLKEVIALLHPTPAVCGFPKWKAKEFILANEGYDREFYSGFLGELNHDFEKSSNATELYVNLRCMKVERNENSELANVGLYIGGGITKDSSPEKEWLETVNKSKTMKKIL